MSDVTKTQCDFIRDTAIECLSVVHSVADLFHMTYRDWFFRKHNEDYNEEFEVGDEPPIIKNWKSVSTEVKQLQSQIPRLSYIFTDCWTKEVSEHFQIYRPSLEDRFSWWTAEEYLVGCEFMFRALETCRDLLPILDSRDSASQFFKRDDFDPNRDLADVYRVSSADIRAEWAEAVRQLTACIEEEEIATVEQSNLTPEQQWAEEFEKWNDPTVVKFVKWPDFPRPLTEWHNGEYAKPPVQELNTYGLSQEQIDKFNWLFPGWDLDEPPWHLMFEDDDDDSTTILNQTVAMHFAVLRLRKAFKKRAFGGMKARPHQGPLLIRNYVDLCEYRFLLLHEATMCDRNRTWKIASRAGMLTRAWDESTCPQVLDIRNNALAQLRTHRPNNGLIEDVIFHACELSGELNMSIAKTRETERWMCHEEFIEVPLEVNDGRFFRAIRWFESQYETLEGWISGNADEVTISGATHGTILEPKITLVTRDDIAVAIGRESIDKQAYSFGKPRYQNSGQIPARYSLEEIKPILDKEFPDHIDSLMKLFDADHLKVIQAESSKRRSERSDFKKRERRRRKDKNNLS